LDTKSKKHRLSLTVICYFTALCLLWTGLSFGVSFVNLRLYEKQYIDTEVFGQSVTLLLNDSIYALTLDTNSDPPYLAADAMQYEMVYRWEGVNIYIRNNDTGIEYTNTGVQSPEGFMQISQEDDFSLYFGGGAIKVYEKGALRPDLSGYIQHFDEDQYTQYDYAFDYNAWPDNESGSLYNKLIYISIPQISHFKSAYTENYYQIWQNPEPILVFTAAALGIVLMCITLGHGKMRGCGMWSASAFQKVPFEIKYSIGIAAGIVSAMLYAETFDNRSAFSENLYVQAARLALVFLILLLWHILWWDLRYNGFKSFAINIPTTMYRMVKRQNMRFPFQKRIQRQFVIIFCLLIICGTFCLFAALLTLISRSFVFLVASIFLFLCCLIMVYKLVSDYFDIISQLGEIIGHINTIAHGDTEAILPEMTPIDDLYPLYYAIRAMQISIKNAIDTRLQSEKMKVDLITNVSHDLKTPLTSVITYVDLLKRSELTEQQQEYVEIIDEKSQRLKVLMSDIFDLSKASSGNVKLNPQVLCVNHLAAQAIGENADALEAAGVTAILSKSEEYMVVADGEKLYRVFENLLINISKYALAGSRAYVDIICQNGMVSIIFKNTSNYPMNFSGEQMKEKFVQGDISRNTEGSGLGLAICDRFVEIMGGTLNIVVDGDLFKAVVTFPQAPTQTK